MSVTAIALAIATTFPVPVAASPNALVSEPEAQLAAATLAQGKSQEAIRLLESELAEHPDDPAILINLGIAYAHRGDEAKARLLFEEAMANDESVELETANGSEADSQRLARKALAMLERGEFRSRALRSGTLTLRD